MRFPGIALLVVSIALQAFVHYAAAESVKVKLLFNQITHAETVPANDVQFYFIILLVREAIAVFENGGK